MESATNLNEILDDGRVARLRRQRRLVENGRHVNRRSNQTICEHQSMDWHYKLALSAAATADTAALSTPSIESPETPSDSVRVREVPLTPVTDKTSYPDIVIASRTFPSTDSSLNQIPIRHGTKNSRIAPSYPLPTPKELPRGQRYQSSAGERWSGGEDCHTNSMPIIPNELLLTPTFNERRRFPKPKSGGLASHPKPNLQRYSTAPASPSPFKETNVLDHVLMHRALVIRQNLISFEMQELAEEAEKAAESGLDKFVGSASKFGVEETLPYRPQFAYDEEFVSSKDGDEFRTPLRSGKSFVDTLTNRIDYTPSYFTRKKIPVRSLRNFSEVVPKFCEMHSNIRIHLESEGVDTNMLPELHTRRSLMLNETEDTDRECGDEVLSQVPSVADSINSFSSYAAASLASIRNNIIGPASSLSNVSLQSFAASKHHQFGLLKKTHHTVVEKKGTSTLPQPPLSVNSDSDDSSVEFYGRKSPSVSSNVSERRKWNPTLSQSSSSNIPVGNMRLKNVAAHSVAFENEKETYKALLDRMQNSPGNRVRATSFDVDQNSCAPSLATLELFPSSSTTREKVASPVADFLTKLQNQFSLTTEDGHHTPPIDEDNKLFVTNYFYTMQDSDVAEPNNGLPTLNLEINPKNHRDSHFLQGCGSNNCLYACDTATKYADRIFNWFLSGKDPKVEKPRSIIDPNSLGEQSPNPKWINSSQPCEPQDQICRRKMFVPPKLSFRHTIHQSGPYCSNQDSAEVGFECDDSILACPEIEKPISCPETVLYPLL
ncbi:hypothetical protein ACHAXA_010561 [Cyclostephanos tholiformis]|jgi:hypothetical protein|uniref:Uncharacterized protein n=1 Tax=Cyclostephanos tholiformis TaxID=382380 RepID=A0ABD3REW3_9STRA